MARKRPTIADIRANKGKYQYTMMRTENWEELAAAEEAGIDMCSVPPEMIKDRRFRDVAPLIFAVPGLALYSAPATTDDYMRWAFDMMNAGADAIYCAAAFDTVERMARDNIPVIGHALHSVECGRAVNCISSGIHHVESPAHIVIGCRRC